MRRIGTRRAFYFCALLLHTRKAGCRKELLARDSTVSEHFTRQVIAFADTLTKSVAILAASAALLAPRLVAAEPPSMQLKSATSQAFDHYVALTDERNTTELRGEKGLLWVDALPEDQRNAAYEALQRGEVKIQRLETRDNGVAIPCPGGLIHHWVAAVFIPRAKLDNVLHILQDYNHHAEYFAPDVQQSRLELQDGDRFKVFLRFRRHKIITVVLNTEHDVYYFHDGPGGAHSRSSTVRIAQVENAGTTSEKEKTPGDDDGFLWRMETWWRMREGDGGVYVQSEVASLTRDIPSGLGWLIRPFVTGIPKETLTFTMQAARKAVTAKLQN